LYSHFFFPRKFSSRKFLGPKNDVTFSGCTTDSGGGGTGFALQRSMKELDLCCEDNKYLVGFCCLHTLQLTLANPLKNVIGQGGLEERNATQAIHSFYDLQNVMEFGVWRKEWNRAAETVAPEWKGKVKKLAAPIVTRWWTVGEAARLIVLYLPILVQIVKNAIQSTRTDSKVNKIASGLKSLIDEVIIVSDIKFLACFHASYLNSHFSWLQKGDMAIGDTPGFLGRHMLLRYFFMRKDLEGLRDNGWKTNNLMKNFVQSLEGEEMAKLIPDPADPRKNEEKRKISCKAIQEKKANKFFQLAFASLEKHFVIFAKDLFFLALYGEIAISQAAAKLLLSAHAMDDNEDTAPGDKTVFSEYHQRNIDIGGLVDFLKKNVDLDKQKQSFHVQQITQDVMGHLAGKK